MHTQGDVPSEKEHQPTDETIRTARPARLTQAARTRSGGKQSTSGEWNIIRGED